MMLADALCRRGELKDRRFDIVAVDDSFVLQFVPEPVRRTAGVDAVGIAARVRKTAALTGHPLPYRLPAGLSQT